MDYVCKICGKNINGNKKHFYLNHNISQEQYCVTYEPRYSKHTGESIKFKNFEQYLSTDFNGKGELSIWLKDNKESKIYAINFLEQRMSAGKLVSQPSYVELASLVAPSLKWYKTNFDYNKLCLDLGLKIKFDLDNVKFNFKKEPTILIDTREKSPFVFPNYKSRIETLSYGDYILDKYRFKVSIERKEIKDFISSCGRNFLRLCREIERAARDKAYLIILVESPLSTALNFSYVPYIKKNIKVNEDFIWHNIRVIMQKYDNVQFVFAKNKKDANELAWKIFLMKQHPRRFDIQYCIERKYFNNEIL